MPITCTDPKEVVDVIIGEGAASTPSTTVSHEIEKEKKIFVFLSPSNTDPWLKIASPSHRVSPLLSTCYCRRS